MIKLNNKNITYVALADSNNSLKAPKEIWYADSNNSVKLVYRRKDALIEGEDYEKYHFVKGDGSAYIRTNHTLNENLDWEVKVANFTDYKCLFWQRNGEVTNNLNTVLVKSVNYYPGFRVGNKSSEVRINPFTDTEITVSTSNDTIVINGQTYQVTKGTSTISGNFALFYTAFHLDSTTQDVCCAYFRFLDSNRNYIQNLVPCKLLKPVPKWLDANGIRRQVGECGMIDLISGKFYGNVNSVGTFAVENYYERKEWLQGDYVAYIDTNVIVNVATLLISTKIHRSNSTGNFFIFGSRDIANINDPSTSSVVISPQSFRCDIIDGNNIFDSSSIASIELSFPTMTINSQSLTTQRVPTTSQNTFRIFTTSVVNSGAYCFNGGISGFVLNDGSNSLNLIPCTLTMDLPASMDANNIARAKGTSGMWDLVSDKFYGNVANSGTFKAVNLAEGVDYEVHQWLVGDGSAYIQGIEYDLWNNHLQVIVGKVEYVRKQYYIRYQSNNHNPRFNILFDVANNEDTFVNIFRENSDTYPHIADIQYNSMPDVIEEDFYINNSLFYCLQNGSIRTNNPSQTAIESSWTAIQPQIYSAKMSYIREVLPDSTYKSNLIPVKLLKSIPSKYDANGIARQAGECGMYDTVNDVFYGNVASSGSFTVSDN